MTEALKDFFRHTDSSGYIDASARHCYIQSPARINSADRILSMDKTAADGIRSAEAVIERLKEYRLALYERHREILASNYRLRLQLRRVPGWTSGVTYTVTLRKVFDLPGITEDSIISENYTGKDRHTAIKRYRELLKQYPGIDAEMDIQKKPGAG